MILITGAAGKTGRGILKALTSHNAPVRALVRRSEDAQPLLDMGAVEVQVGDINQSESLQRAVQGIGTIYHICPNVNPNEIEIGRELIAAARIAGVKHFVYHSVLHPQVEAMPHHWQKMRVEEMLFKSGLEYTILQPAAYMQNVLAGWDSITKQGIYSVPYSVETCLSMVDLEDLAEAAARVLTEKGHEQAIYELCGPQALTQEAIAQILSVALNRVVIAKTVDRGEWAARSLAAGMGKYALDTLLKMFEYYEIYGFQGNPQVLGWLLNRPPTPFHDFINRQLK